MGTGPEEELSQHIICQVEGLRASIDDHRGLGTILRGTNRFAVDLGRRN